MATLVELQQVEPASKTAPEEELDTWVAPEDSPMLQLAVAVQATVVHSYAHKQIS